MRSVKRVYLRKLVFATVASVVLVLGLAVTSVALARASAFSESANVKIHLDNDAPLICIEDGSFAPGSKVIRNFEVKNTGRSMLSYRLYFDNVEGALGDIVQVIIKDGDQVLYQGTINQLNKYDNRNVGKMLTKNDPHELTAEFYYPPDQPMLEPGMGVTFDLCAVGMPYSSADALMDQYVAAQGAASGNTP